MHKKRKTTLWVALAVTLVICGTAYTLANRYLIEHVEVANVSGSPSSSPTENAAAQPEEAEISALSTENNLLEAESDSAVMDVIIADEWNYQSASLSIRIRQVSDGSGANKVTYYIADVTLSDATQLASAFADDSFGRNIIEYTSVIAEQNDAIFAINGDYYGFRTDGIIIRNGTVYRDIPARIGLAFYRDGSMLIYDETQTSAEELVENGVWNTLSFGPALLQNSDIVENLGSVEIDNNLGNHSIQGSNPRTGVGIISANHFVFIVVDGRSQGYSRGLTLNEFALLFQSLGCTDAYNLDGGGSSTMYFHGRVVNNPLGRGQERGTSDILFIGD